MAYAAVTSLLWTIDRLLHFSAISVAPSTRKILEFASQHVRSLERALGKFDQFKNGSDGVKAWDALIRDEARKLEYAIELHASTQFLSQSEGHEGRSPTVSLNLDELRQDIDCFATTAKKMGDEYIQELQKSFPQEEDDAATDSGGDERGMVGLSDQFMMIRDVLIAGTREVLTASISGMAGIGKTTLARKLFHDSLVEANFECRAFVRIGRKYELEAIMRAIVAQVNLDNDKIVEDENLDRYFRRSLNGRKYLIVLDDMWDVGFYRAFTRKLPIEQSRSWILVTCRDSRAAKTVSNVCYQLPKSVRHLFYKMRFLNPEESWDLLRRKVFGEEGYCPSQLVKAGMKIAENCEGLPLLILTVAEILSKSQKNREYWYEVAEKRNSVFEDAYDQITEVLLPSYHYIDLNLKACFLYMGAYPENYIVPRSKITKLWRAEGFVGFLLGIAFDELVSSNLVVDSQRSSSSDQTKACSLHCAYRHLNKREAENNKFIHILNSYADASIERMKSKPILAICNNILFAIEEVRNSMALIATVRSLLCTGPYHQYQVPICLELRLLRVIDALTIRFYEFPVEVVKLIQLRYLALTCNANLPSSISKLWNLEFLIVHQHLSIKRIVAESYVPEEIWYLQELKHLQIIGRNLPDPPPSTVLPNLEQLLDVGPQTCAKGVLESIPALQKLRIQIELEPDIDAAQTLSCFDHISCLHDVKSLQSVIINPELLREPVLLSIAIHRLEKLSLSGFGYPWEDMSKIAELPNLTVLKLQNYAFQGEKWEAKEKGFPRLWCLLIEDTDLVQWIIEDGTFPVLSRLTMKNCYHLEEIPLLSSFENIEMVDCNPLLVETFGKQLVDVHFNAKYSWK